MKTSGSIYLSAITFLFLSTMSALLFAADQNSKTDTDWDFYMQSIDPYANEDDEQKKPTKPINKPNTSMPVAEPPPLPNGATPQQISEYNRKMQKSLRDRQKQELNTMFETVESMGYHPEQPEKPAPDFTITSTSNSNHEGYSAKKTNFDWGGKESGYTYADYEFIFESTNVENAQKMTESISEMAKAGWEVDLNRSFQRVQGNGDNAKAFTTTQMRFRRRK